MPDMKTPGIYIVEKNAFPNSVVEVASAIPAFIGYTDKADNQGISLLNKPYRISSMAEYLSFYGFAPHTRFTIDEVTGGDSADISFSLANKDYTLRQTAGHYLLYYSMQLFFQNGGGPCYIVSTGTCTDGQNNEVRIDADKLINGIDQLINEQEPTLLIIPEAVLLNEQDSVRVQQAALEHCGGKRKIALRFSISTKDTNHDRILRVIVLKISDQGSATIIWPMAPLTTPG